MNRKRNLPLLLTAVIVVLAIAVATVFGQSWRAANSNPVDAIKR